MSKITPGIYRHYKGNDYEVIGLAKHSETLEDMVVYKPLYDQSLAEYWVRPQDMFFEDVDNRPRFEYLSPIHASSVRVGVSCIVKKDNKVLLGKRKNAHGQDSWAFPGGHLEFGETPEDCAKRELMEETSLNNIHNIKIIGITNDFFEQEKKHYITIHVVCDYVTGNVKICEPQKCEIWEWLPWDDLPTPLFLPIQNLQKQKFNPFA